MTPKKQLMSYLLHMKLLFHKPMGFAHGINTMTVGLFSIISH